MPHVLVVEDEEHLAIGIKFNLEAEGFEVSVVGDGQAALERIVSADPSFDLVVLDIMLPGMSGYAVCEAIRGKGNTVPIVMLTARTLVEDRIRGFDAGTDIYLQKPFDIDELISIVRSLVARRGRGQPGATGGNAADPADGRDESICRFSDCEVNFETWEARSGDRPIRLTSLEMKLLKYLVEHEGVVVSRTELLERVWGMVNSPATRTVDTFMLNLRKYFEKDPSRPVHFLSVRGTGYRFVRKPG